MQLRLSVVARNRAFSKAMRPVRAKIQPLLTAFEAIGLECPIHAAILVGITDDKSPEFFEKIENNDGFFQLMAGCSYRGSDDELTKDVFEILHRAVRACPFATTDSERFENLFARLQLEILKP